VIANLFDMLERYLGLLAIHFDERRRGGGRSYYSITQGACCLACFNGVKNQQQFGMEDYDWTQKPDIQILKRVCMGGLAPLLAPNKIIMGGLAPTNP